ncbi:ROK family glucokinase [Roseburia hominis]
MEYCFGVDVGGTTVKLGLFQADGTLLDKWEVKTRTENDGEAILPDIAETIQNKMREKSLEREQILGIGMGIPAPVTDEGIVRNTANLGWGYKEVKRELEELTGMRVAPGNDANVAALGEMWMGGGRGCRDMIMVTLGTGVGGGVIVDGKCVVGSHGAGGEIGHIRVNYEETECCGCGNKGCLEQYASATGIARLARRRLVKDDQPSILREESLEAITAKSVFDAVKEGDQVAIQIAEEFGNYLGNALVNLAAICDPDVVVIGGGVSKAGEVLLGYIEKPFREKAFFANKDMRFVLAELANDAGIYGAVKLLLA